MNAVTEQTRPISELDEATRALLAKLIDPMRRIQEERDGLLRERQSWGQEREELLDENNALRARVHTETKLREQCEQREHRLGEEASHYMAQVNELMTTYQDAIAALQRGLGRCNEAVLRRFDADGRGSPSAEDMTIPARDDSGVSIRAREANPEVADNIARFEDDLRHHLHRRPPPTAAPAKEQFGEGT